jgi:predicted RNA-binding Zn-ribbon protein involved in translation (DUF1610 family)
MSEVNLRMGRDFFERQCPSCGEWVPASSETQQFTVPHECGWITMMRKAARCDELEVRVAELEKATRIAAIETEERCIEEAKTGRERERERCLAISKRMGRASAELPFATPWGVVEAICRAIEEGNDGCV